MKAEFILKAIAAMGAAESAYMCSPTEQGRIAGELTNARIDLEIQSGLRAIEIPVEKALA